MQHLTPDLLIYAYSQGVFPMAIEDDIGWFSPDPRAIIPIDAFHVSHTLAARARSGVFEIRINTAFAQVIQACGERKEGTWISKALGDAYCRLHEQGFAHSVESWHDGKLAGGLYGVALGGAFFGESMFFRHRDASKVALVALVERMRERKFALLDVQYSNPHLTQFGVHEIPRKDYLRRLAAALESDCRFAD